MTDTPRFIEQAFPLKQTSLDSVHEKNVRHGHISTLHIWPARRPLAACRAALLATLLPDRPRDIEDDGLFHYAVLGIDAASDPGKPNPEAVRFLEETTGPDKPRVFRNAVLLLAPSRHGVEVATTQVRDYLAWEQVRADLKEQERNGHLDVVRMETLSNQLSTARGRIAESIRHAWSTVVTLSEQKMVQAFKIIVTDDHHFQIIKNDRRARIQESAVTAEALLPDGPYNLWRDGETARRVKDLAGAFAQQPHLPKMLKTQAILDTLVDGCVQGAFVLRLTRPDRSFRSWWHDRPEGESLLDPAMELVLPEAAKLATIPPDLLAPGRLPNLWKGDTLTVQEITAYFSGNTTVQIQREGYQESVPIPGAEAEVVHEAVHMAVEQGRLWLTNGPSSLLAEPVLEGMLGYMAMLRSPPASIPAAEILPENLPDAWKNGIARASSIATFLSLRENNTLPWKTVRDVITAALSSRFLELDETSGEWPCDDASANQVKLKVPSGKKTVEHSLTTRKADSKSRTARADLEPSAIQELGDLVPKLLEIKAKNNVPMRFCVEIELGDDKKAPSEAVVNAVNALLESVNKGFQWR